MDTDAQVQVIRESFGRIVYTHKTHEKQREWLSRVGNASKWTNIVLLAITLSGIIVSLGSQNSAWLFMSSVTTLFSGGYAIYQLSFDPEKEAELHTLAAKRLLAIRNRYINLLADIASGRLTLDEIAVRRDELDEQSVAVYSTAPNTNARSYSAASRALKVNEDFSFSDEEINQFLPTALKS